MTAATIPTVPPARLDPTAAAPIPLGRLVQVELRKLVDTRAGRWLLIVQAALILIACAVVTIVAAVQDEPLALMDFVGVAGGVMSLLLPVMGILAVTTEWSQRTHMATFTLEPRRGRVILAKCGAALLAAAASIVLAFVIGVVTSAVAALVGVDLDWFVDVDVLAGFALAQVFGMLTGFALGALILSTPAAIVAYFAYWTVLPGLFAVGAEQLGWFADIQPWIDFADAQLPLTEDGLTQADWPELIVSGLLWLGLPLALGITRIRRAEIK